VSNSAFGSPFLPAGGLEMPQRIDMRVADVAADQAAIAQTAFVRLRAATR
jgi:hypothetical protein